MKKNFLGVIAASVLSLTAFSVSAQQIKFDEWTKATKGDSMTIVNVNRQDAVLSVNCQAGNAWVAIETRLGTLVYPDPNTTPGDDTLSLELMVTTRDGTLVRWTPDDLDFNKPNGAGNQRIQTLFDSLHEARKLEVLLGGEYVIPFEGVPAKAFPKFNEVASYCKA